MTDKLYRLWISKQPSCISGKFSEWVEAAGEWRNIACHVRRAKTFGTGFKAEYSCVPMTHAEHLIQSCQGEAAVLGQYLGLDATLSDSVETAKQWFDEQVEKYLRLWRLHSGTSIEA